MTYELICPFCHRDCNIEVEVESPSDYYYNSECDQCRKTIKQFSKHGKILDLDIEIMNEVGEDIFSEAEFRADCAMDR